MSIKVMSKIWDDKSLGPTDRLILLSLADHANDEGVCYPSIHRLSERTGLSERATQVAIKRMREAGYLKIDRNNGPKGCNVYTVYTPAGDAPPQEMHPRRRCATPPQEMRPTPAGDAPEPSGTIIEPSDKDHPPDDPVPAFSEFWEVWPLRKIGKQKAKAAFGRLSKQNKRNAVSSAAKWAGEWRRANPTANDIHPTTYLNGRRWEDENGAPSNIARMDGDRQARLDRWKRAAGGQ